MVGGQPEMATWQNPGAEVQIEEEQEVGSSMVVASPEVGLP
jgi:hypothetical protein